MELSEFTAVLDELTKNTYVLIIVHDPKIGREGVFSLASESVYSCNLQRLLL